MGVDSNSPTIYILIRNKIHPQAKEKKMFVELSPAAHELADSIVFMVDTTPISRKTMMDVLQDGVLMGDIGCEQVDVEELYAACFEHEEEIVQVVDGGIMFFDNEESWQTWEKQI